MKLTPEGIIKTVADYFNITVNCLILKCRKIEYVKARHLAMYFIHKYFGLTLERPDGLTLVQIGNLFGDRDHATVCHARHSVINQFDTDRKYRKIFTDIKQLIAKEETKKIDYRFTVTINFRFYCFKKFHKFYASKTPFHVYFLKHEFKAAIEPVMIKRPVNAIFLYANIASCNGREMHGYREHQL